MSDGKRLKAVAHLVAGQSPSSDDVSDLDDGMPFIQGNAEFGSQHPTPRLECDVAPKVAEPGDLLLSVRAPVGALNTANQRIGIGRGVCAIRPFASDGRYLWWWLHSQEEKLEVVSTGTTFKAVSTGQVSNLWVPTTDAAQQRAIAEYLDWETAQIDATIDAQQRLVALLVERRTSVVLRSVMNRNDVTWRGQLGRVLSKLDRSIEGDSEVVTAYRDGVVVRRSERRNDGYTFSDLEQGYQGVKAGDLVFHGLDGFAGAVGVARSGGKCSPVYHVCTAAVGVADNRYLGHLLRSYGHVGLLAAHAWSVRQRSVDYRNWKQLAALPIELPSHLDQLRTVESLEKELAGIDRMGERVHASVALLRERRAALITAAVTGRIDPRTGVERLDEVLEGAAS